MDKCRVRWHVLFSGKVQQVGFRYTAVRLAGRLSVSGWVDNLPDGRVEMEAQGAVSALRKLILLLKSQPHIHITHLEIREIPCRGRGPVIPGKAVFLPRRPENGA